MRQTSRCTRQWTATCYALTLTHTGTGSDPTASPANSTGCAAGQYAAGAVISLTAAPASGWTVGSWTGTDNDASTSTTNQVTMPAAAHAASVAYTEIQPACNWLVRTHTGAGSNPVASPIRSTGCAVGLYVADEVITLTAAPDSGWTVGSWLGTNDDTSTSTTNTVVMPDWPQTVTVNYVEIPPVCYALTLTHTGTGSDPAASPTNSTGCSAGQYVAGAVISLTAAPGSGWKVGSWTGTDDDASTSTTNQVTMPAAAHAASVTYTEIQPTCYALTRIHTGNGTDPVASPANSTGCTSGQYVAAAVITLTATPGSGWTVGSWIGTDNDGSAATTNQVTMPAAVRTVTVNYIEIPPTCYALTLTHTGTGTDPAPSPANSTGCAPGQYLAGTVVSLTATPGAGWTVGSWSGTDNNASTATTNTVTMPAAARTATVNYVQIFSLTIAVDPLGSGTTNPAVGVHTYTSGAVVAVTATPAAGYKFDSWSGACTGAGSCSVTMDANKTVTAHFSVRTYYLYLPLISKNQ